MGWCRDEDMGQHGVWIVSGHCGGVCGALCGVVRGDEDMGQDMGQHGVWIVSGISAYG